MSPPPCRGADVRITDVRITDDPPIIYPKWQTELMAALAETNPNNVPKRVKEAQKAISRRFWAIWRGTSHESEIEAIAKALDCLDGLRGKVSFPKAS